jgi:single-stranded-DNA-specific exonuclease
LSREALDVISAVWDSTLVITTDCGSSDVAAVAHAQTLGIDIIVTDHHQPPAELPQAYALVNPWRKDCTYGERTLCGVGIAFKLAQALLRAHGREAEAGEYLDLVAVGTVGDVAPLLGENHTLVRLGLEQLNRTGNVGLRALMRTALLVPGSLRERDISHAIAPRINAAGRMKDAYLAFELLTTEDEATALAIAEEIEALNLLRRQRTEELLVLARREAQGQLGDPVVLVSGAREDWPEGIIGLVAGKLSEEFGRPAFVLSVGQESSRGSGRSGADFNIIEALGERGDLFEVHGGHAQAAGFSIANSRVEELRAHLSACAVRSAPADAGGAWARMVDITVRSPEVLRYDVYGSIRQLAPFGADFPEPVFRMNGVTLTRRWLSGQDGRDLRVRLKANNVHFSGTYAHGGSHLNTFREGAPVDVIFTLDLALRAPEGASQPGIWLKVLSIETAPETVLP